MLQWVKDNMWRFKWRGLSGNQLGVTGWIQGTGYTSEAGYEIFVPNEQVVSVWRALIDAGATPVGLGNGYTFVWRKDTSCPVLISCGLNLMMGHIRSSHEIMGNERTVWPRHGLNSLDVRYTFSRIR